MFGFRPLLWVTIALSAIFPFSAFADMSGTATIQVSSSGTGTYSFDAGATPGCSGDIVYGGGGSGLGGNVTTAGIASIYVVPGAGGLTEFNSLTENELKTQTYSGAPINNIVVGTVFAVQTNGGHYAKVLVTAVGGTSLALQYLTYGVTAGAPVIVAVQNNYSWAISVAPGALFVVSGCGLAQPGTTPVLQDSAQGLPLTLNGVSLSVQAGGVTTQPAIYYTSPTQIAAVLPSATPSGGGTISVTYGQATASAPLAISPVAFGFGAYYGTGGGLAIVTDASYNLVTSTNAAQPGQTITFWGTGLGPSIADSDTAYTPTPHPISVADFPLHVQIGGVEAAIAYAGRSPYPGLDQVNVTVPQGITPGCAVSVVAMNAEYFAMSNFVTLPISTNGGTCSDPLMGISAAQIASLSTKPTVNVGVLSVTQDTTGDTLGSAEADFFAIPGPSLAAWAATQFDGWVASTQYGVPVVSLGSCLANVYPIPAVAPAWYWSGPLLDAGSMTLTDSGGSQALPEIPGTQLWGLLPVTLPGTPMVYGTSLTTSSWQSPFTPISGGAYTFAAAGGKDVGGFNATLNLQIPESFPSPWIEYDTNSGSAAPAVEINYMGQTFTWTGGRADSYITFVGTNGSSSLTASGSFVCNAPAAAGQFTIPMSVWKALYGATYGLISAQVNTFPQPFSATGLDAAYAVGTVTPWSLAIAYP